MDYFKHAAVSSHRFCGWSLVFSSLTPSVDCCKHAAVPVPLLQVFCATGDKAHEEMRQACFDYLSLGGIYSSGPVSLLSGKDSIT